MSDHFDVIIIGTGASGGTLAYCPITLNPACSKIRIKRKWWQNSVQVSLI